MTLTTAHAAGKGNGGGGGGGGGDVIGGTIYYYGNFPGWGSGTPTISMNADGSNKTVLGSDGWSTIFGEPSIHLHNNHRWFPKAFSLPDPDHIPTEEEPYKYLEYPDGSWRYELFALRGDYNPYSNNTPHTGALLLADDPAFQLLGGQHWLLNDEYISFVARR